MWSFIILIKTRKYFFCYQDFGWRLTMNFQVIKIEFRNIIAFYLSNDWIISKYYIYIYADISWYIQDYSCSHCEQLNWLFWTNMFQECTCIKVRAKCGLACGPACGIQPAPAGSPHISWPAPQWPQPAPAPHPRIPAAGSPRGPRAAGPAGRGGLARPSQSSTCPSIPTWSTCLFQTKKPCQFCKYCHECLQRISTR